MRLLLPAARTIAVTFPDAVAMVDADACHPMLPHLGIVEPSKAHDYQLVADLAQPRGGAVQHADAGPCPRRNGVGLEPAPVVDVDHLYEFGRQNAGRTHQAGIKLEAALVLEILVGNDQSLDL